MTNALSNNALFLSYMKNIYNRLKAIRQDRGLSQDEMSDLLHKTQSSYARIERGATKLDVETLFDFAKVLDMRPIDVMTYPDVYVKQDSTIVNEPKGDYIISKSSESVDNSENEISLNVKIRSKETRKEILKMIFGSGLDVI